MTTPKAINCPPNRGISTDYDISVETGHGRGGLAHQWWVDTIARWLEDKGVTPVIEDDSLGARVDLAFKARRKRIAVEVETSDGHELENIRKDRAAGFDVVVSLIQNPTSLERLEEKYHCGSPDEPPEGVRFAALADFEACLANLLEARHASPQRPNQNKERRPSRGRAEARRPPRAPARGEAPFLPEPGVLTTPAAAEYLGLSPATLETLRSRGGGPTFAKLGRRVVYRREDLDSWVDERTKRSTSDEPNRQ